MSQLAIRNALSDRVYDILSAEGISCAWENKDFDPDGTYCSFYFNPVTSESLAKSANGWDDDRGFIQVSVFVPLNDENGDTQQLEIIDTIKASFYNSLIVDGIRINEVTVNGGYKLEGHYKRDVTIYYTVFNSRG